MLKHLLIACSLLIVCYSSLYAIKAEAYDNNDFQNWETAAVNIQANEVLQLALENQFRIGNNSTDFYYDHLELNLLGKFSDYLKLGGGFRYTYAKNQSANTAWKSEYRPIMTALLEFGSDRFKLSSRNRFEYRIPDGAPNRWWYRNLVELDLPLIFAKPEIRPFLADEIFINLNPGDFSENRIFAGFKIKPMERLEGKVYYLRQSFETSNRWKSNNIMGISVTTLF